MKKIWQKYMLVFIAVPIFAGTVIATMFFSKILAACEAVVFFALCFAFVFYTYVKNIEIVTKIKDVSGELDTVKGSALSRVPFLCAAFDESGKIFWFNSSFAADFFPEGRSATDRLEEVLGAKLTDFTENDIKLIKAPNDRQYTAHTVSYTGSDGKTAFVIYLIDDTELKITEEKYFASRPCIVLVAIDTVEEIRQGFKDSECGAIFGRIEEIIDKWAEKYKAYCRKISTGRFVVIVEQQYMSLMTSDKFKVLEYVRSLTYSDKKINATLSLGIGRGESLTECDSNARLALDMAQSRGGDQVAIREGSEYTFFGGVSSGFENSSKIKARLVASSFSELISACENVMIMGHRFSDLDSFGSSLGILSIARGLKKPAAIAINKETALAKPLILKAEKEGLGEFLVSPDKAEYMVSENTLLVVADTHKPDFTERPSLLDKTKNIVVIDHHRKAVKHIENAVLFFHTSYASSASEMITELAQYIDRSFSLDSFTAEALLSGIMLDTRNFVLRTGVRTFQAAAYLRSRGADTVEVKKLFSNDMEVNKFRNQVVDGAEKYRDCAISVANIKSDNIRLVTSQAADELLNLDGIKSSFVLFKLNDTVCISARSFGNMNVQLIMEKFGGGGHSTMAAAQITGADIEEILKSLKKEIDIYFENL